MPTYEYVCAKCGHEFETIQPMSAKPLMTCLEAVCARKKWGRGKVQRKIGGGGGLLFKGSGFYITDYRSEGYKKAAKSDAVPAVKSESKSTKPEAATSKPAKSEGGAAKSSTPGAGKS